MIENKCNYIALITVTLCIISGSSKIITGKGPLVSVEITKQTSKNSIRDKIPSIATIKGVNIVTWFTGDEGAIERGLRFYQKNLFGQLNAIEESRKNKTPLDYRLYLYNLVGWKAFKDPSVSLTDPSKSTLFTVTKSAKLINSKWQLAYATDFFTWIKKLGSKATELLKNILSRKEPWFLSKSLLENKKILPNNLTVAAADLKTLGLFDNKYDTIDTADFYSAFQYIEGLYLVYLIATNAINNNPNVNTIPIVFLLPKGETNYYVFNADGGKTFGQDASNLLGTCFSSIPKAKINVSFTEFTYQGPGTSRPYIKTSGEKLASDTFIKNILLSNK